MSNYSDKLKDPRWQRKRLYILERDNWTCQVCGETKKTLHVHHRFYTADNPWDSDNDNLITICERCHQLESLRVTPGARLTSFKDVLEWYVLIETPVGLPWHIEPLWKYLASELSERSQNLPGHEYRIIGIFPSEQEADRACNDFEKRWTAKRRRIGLAS